MKSERTNEEKLINQKGYLPTWTLILCRTAENYFSKEKSKTKEGDGGVDSRDFD
jgi:hypothetical protein